MNEKAIDLDIPLLLPGVTDDQDACLDRLEAALQNQKGLQRAHIERDKTPIEVCLHYDPDVISLADVKQLAERAGTQIVNCYHHALLPIENMDCSDCVLVIKHSVGRVDVVKSIGLFLLAGLCEIGGGYLVWQWLREGKSIWVRLIGGMVLVLYGIIPTLQPAAINFGRVYAAYGGVFVVLSQLWGWQVDRKTPDTFDPIGGLICLIGVAVIVYWPRGT